MSKSASDTKVKKTLLRSYEMKIKPTANYIAHDVVCSSNSIRKSRPEKENDLSQPSLCSSEVLAKYISNVKKSTPAPLSYEDLNNDKLEIAKKVTKKLNFHFNDRIYKNLIELNGNIEELKNKKDKRASSTVSIKKDLEPNIEDFYEDEKEIDSPPNIPVLQMKFKPVKKVEDGQLHKLVASFEYS